QRALAKGRANAVRSGIAAADHDDLFAGRQDRVARERGFTADAPILLRQIVHRKMNTFELVTRHRQVARFFGAAREYHRIMLRDQFVRVDSDADICAIVEHHAFSFHLGYATIDVVLLHLEIGNAVTQKPAGFGPALIDVNVVPGARKLLRAGKPGRPGTHDRDLLSGPLRRRFRPQAVRDGAIGDRAFDRFDGDRILVDVKRT